MTQSDNNHIVFAIKKAAENDIYSHLVRCDEEFSPRLSTRVDLSEYSGKLHESSITFEAWNEGLLISLVAGYFNDKGKRVYISNVSTEKIHWGKGLGKKLIVNLIEFAKTKKFNDIRLDVYMENSKAIQLYEHLNFIKTERKNDFFTYELAL